MKIKIDNEELWTMITNLVNAEINYDYAVNYLTGVRTTNAEKTVDEERRKLRATLLLPKED